MTRNVGSRGAVVKRLAQVVGSLLVPLAVALACAGTLAWPWAWGLLACGLAVVLVNVLVLPKDLIAERGAPRENVKAWDRLITRLSLVPFFAVYVVAGLDHRLGWTPDATALHLAGLAAGVLGNAVFTWAMRSNRYFSTMVRIQEDRGHSVATGGPYRVVRHPGYAGYILISLATPLILGSAWGLLPGGAVVVLFLVRTALEDRTLQKELAGYADYVRAVRYRLVPYVW